MHPLPLLRMRAICQEVFDNYETRAKKPAYFIKQIEQLQEMNGELYAHGKYMWEKYRKGVKSLENQFDRKFQGKEKQLKEMIAQLEKNEKRGVFYAEMMLHCVWGTPRIRIEIFYKDKALAPTVHNTSPKVVDGVNTVRFAMENKPVDYVLFTLYGEGACYPVHFRYTCGGRKYEVSSVKRVMGTGKDLKNILFNETQFAQLGNNDGQAHIEDVNVSRTHHQLKLKFKTMR